MKTTSWTRAAAGVTALAAAGALVHTRVRNAERDNPPQGRFVTARGVRLHYVEQGEGPALVMLHGLGSMVDDFLLSGLVREAARQYRVIVFDRPGYGHSDRPARWRFGPEEQARVVYEALAQLGVQQPIVLGHSWGTLVAVALALEHPEAVRALVLESGLYFPSVRLDAPLLVPPAIPLIGTLMRHTLSPLAARALWPGWLRAVFAPAPVPRYFDAFPTWLALSPRQLTAVAEEALLTFPATLRLQRRYAEVRVPVVMVVGREDRYVSPRSHTMRLHRLLPASRLIVSPQCGHMVHHTDRDAVLDAIEAAAQPLLA
jgi:pimeloyl-ACP methyl ester carboxylesterase